MANPLAVIREFFSAYHLPQARRHLKEMLEDAMCAVEVYSANYLTICHNIEKLVEAAWLLLQGKEKTQSQTKRDTLSAIIILLASAISPERIFLLSYQESILIDLVLIMPDTAAKPFRHYGILVETACYGIAEVSFSLHSSSRYRHHIEEGHPFWLLCCTDSRQVYEKSNGCTRLIPAGTWEEIKGKAAQVFRLGLVQAGSFWESAKKGWEENDYAFSLFMIYQSVELTCRALIRALTGSEVKEHSIAVLKKHLRRCAPEVNKTIPADTENGKGLLTLLDSAYIKGRYNDAFTPTKEEVLTLLENAGHLQDTADDYITELLGSLPV